MSPVGLTLFLIAVVVALGFPAYMLLRRKMGWIRGRVSSKELFLLEKKIRCQEDKLSGRYIG